MKTLHQEKKKKREMPSYFGKENFWKLVLRLFQSFVLFLDHLYCFDEPLA